MARAKVKKVAAVEPIDPAAKLDAEVDQATAAPAGVVTAKSAAPISLEVVEDENEDGDPVRRLKVPTGKFVAIDKEIFNKQGTLVGTEVSANDAARKADRFNSQTR